MRGRNDSQLNEFETDVIRWLVSAGAAGEGLDRIPDETCGSLTDVNWQLLFDVAEQHRLLPLMYEGARSLRGVIQLPPLFDERLENAFYANLAVSAVQLDHLHDLHQSAETLQSPLYVLKGTAFGGWLYEHPALRPMVGLDVIVDEEHFAIWTDELSELGFEPSGQSDHSNSFHHRLSGTELELHRTLTSCSSYLGVSWKALVDRSEPALGFESEMFRHLCTEDHLLHICLHGSFQHGFRQAAINAWDAVLLTRQTEFDWDRFLARAEDPRLTPWIYAGISMCQRVFPSDGFEHAIGRLMPMLAPRLRQLAVGLETRELLSLASEPTTPRGWEANGWSPELTEADHRVWESLPVTARGQSLEQRFDSLRRGLGAIWKQSARLHPTWKQKHAHLQSGSASLREASDV